MATQQAALQNLLEAAGDLKTTSYLTVGVLGLGYPAYAVVQRWRMQHAPINGTRKPVTFVEFFGVTWKRDGWAGLYKGSVLYLVGLGAGSLALGWFSNVLQSSLPNAFNAFFAKGPVLSSMAAILSGTLMYLPLRLLTSRPLASPQPFSMWTPLANARSLPTPDEREHPLRHMLTTTRFLPTLTMCLSEEAASLGIPILSATYFPRHFWLVATVAQTVVSLLVVTPIETIMDRLDAQRDLANGLASEKLVAEEIGTEEGIVSLRKEQYNGFWDCAQTIVREEGWAALSRGWVADVCLNLVWMGMTRSDNAFELAVQQARLAGFDVRL